jgi:hypothetical protein
MILFHKIIRRFGLLLHDGTRYGFSVAFWNLLDSQKQRIGVFQNLITNKKHSAIINRLTSEFHYLIADFSECLEDINDPPCPVSIPAHIWICWWDGIDAMPPLVRACFNSVKRNAGIYHVQLVTKDNYRRFISIPDYIPEKLNAGKITKTHFSDILRMALLAEHGGIWLDATVLVTGVMQAEHTPLFTVKRGYGGAYAPKRRWTGFCIGGIKNNVLFEFVKKFFYEYWKENDRMIDYFLIDYGILIAYSAFPRIKQMIDNVRNSNPHLYFLQENMENEYTADCFEAISKDTMFHKLTWKGRHMAVLNNRLTYYGYILEQYGENRSAAL